MIPDYLDLRQCDNMELMAQYPDKHFDLAIVDPPYGIGANKMTMGNGKTKIERGSSDWDMTIPNAEYWTELFRVSKSQIVWGGNYMTDFLPPSRCWVLWDKGTGDNDYADGELAWTSFDKVLKIFKKSWVGANAKNEAERIHITEKPVQLYKWLLKNYAKEGDRVLDTHLGSMSIAIAVHEMNKVEKMNLTLTGCELDEDYYNQAMKRVENACLQMSLI